MAMGNGGNHFQKIYGSTLRFWTNPHKIKRMIYLNKLFDYEWTMSYEVSKNSKNPDSN